MILFSFIFAKFRPSDGREMVTIDVFWIVSRIPITQSTSYVVYALGRWVFKNILCLAMLAKLRPHYGCKMATTGGFRPAARGPDVEI